MQRSEQSFKAHVSEPKGNNKKIISNKTVLICFKAHVSEPKGNHLIFK